MVAIPVAIGVAVLRYRLFDIDRVISATVAYALITALLAGAFVAIIVFGGVLLGRGSPIITAAATLAVAVAFRPVRSVVQARVERTFNPTRYRGLHRIDTFLADLRAGRVEPETIGAAIAEAVPDDSLRLFFWLPDQESHADADGNPVPDLPPDPPGQTIVRRGDLRLGTVIHRDDAETRRELEPILVRAGLAVEIARLRVEVRRQLAEVERSRTRIVTAAMDERRRLERDLHDGAQQQLVSIGLDLRHLQNELGSGSPVQDQLDHSVRRLADAIRELRSLAHGVRPSSLDAGLAPALSELAARTPVRTVLDVTSERFAAETEAAAYFVVSEAMANALKHGDPDRIEVHAGRLDGRLVVTVSDDGKGGAVALPGRGLAGIGDRVAALDGRLQHRQPAERRDEGPGGAAMRVVVGEDQALLREGLARLFRDAGHEVVGLATDGDDRARRRGRAPARPRRRRHQDAADVHRRGHPGSRSGSASTIRTSGCSSCLSTSMPPAWSIWCRSAGSATCSRTACSTWATSSTPPRGSPRAARRSIPRSWRPSSTRTSRASAG